MQREKISVEQFWKEESEAYIHNKLYDREKLHNLLHSMPNYTELYSLTSGMSARDVLFAAVCIGYRMGLMVGEIPEIQKTEVVQ